jgi:beta-1,4-N-acetylglucosaminyltransferase
MAVARQHPISHAAAEPNRQVHLSDARLASGHRRPLGWRLRGRRRAGEGSTRRKQPKLAVIASSGGHLTQLLVLQEFWTRYSRFWVTFDTLDATTALKTERAYWAHHPTNRNLWNLLRNTVLALKVLASERPTHVISTGAAVAIPFFWLGRLLGARTIYLEVFDRIDTPTLTGRIVAPVTDHFLVQWPEQLSLYKGAELVGPVL